MFAAETHPKKGLGFKKSDESRNLSFPVPVPSRDLTMSLDYWQHSHPVQLIPILQVQLRYSAIGSTQILPD